LIIMIKTAEKHTMRDMGKLHQKILVSGGPMKYYGEKVLS